MGSFEGVMAKEADAAHRYAFSGRVHPERTYVTLRIQDRVELSIPSLSWTGTVKVSIYCAQISLVFDGGSVIADVSTLKNVAQSLTQNLVDALNYAWGRSYEIEITSVLLPSGDHHVFGVGVPVIEGHKDERPLPPEVVIDLALRNPWLRRALGDLRGAIKEPDDTGFHCMRAVESVRQHFQSGSDVSSAWSGMRRALHLNEDTLKTLGEFGTPQRHGEAIAMTDAQRARDMTLAWRVVDRYVVLLHRDADEIPAEEFPML